MWTTAPAISCAGPLFVSVTDPVEGSTNPLRFTVGGGCDFYPGSANASPSFSFDVSELRVAGEGDLLVQLERLRRRLEGRPVRFEVELLQLRSGDELIVERCRRPAGGLFIADEYHVECRIAAVNEPSSVIAGNQPAQTAT